MIPRLCQHCGTRLNADTRAKGARNHARCRLCHRVRQRLYARGWNVSTPSILAERRRTGDRPAREGDDYTIGIVLHRRWSLRLRELRARLAAQVRRPLADPASLFSHPSPGGFS